MCPALITWPFRPGGKGFFIRKKTHMANQPPRVVRQADLPATVLTQADAVGGAYNVEPIIVAETGQFGIWKLRDGVPYSVYLKAASPAIVPTAKLDTDLVPNTPVIVKETGQGASLMTIDGDDYVLGPEYLFHNVYFQDQNGLTVGEPIDTIFVPSLLNAAISRIDVMLLVAAPNDATHNWLLTVSIGSWQTNFTFNTEEAELILPDTPNRKTYYAADFPDSPLISALTTDTIVVTPAWRDGTPGQLTVFAWAIYLRDVLATVAP